MKKIVLVIDGHCIMCNSVAIWISKRDKENILMITNFDSNYVKENYQRIKWGKNVILINEIEQKIFGKSTAIIQCLKIIGYRKELLYLMDLIPNVIRDWIYDLLAKYRYKIFGKKESCDINSKIPETKILN
jgi:predicted DCC family thiol-disulfide oxidoreductase YuxK